MVGSGVLLQSHDYVQNVQSYPRDVGDLSQIFPNFYWTEMSSRTLRRIKSQTCSDRRVRETL
jgi:hypothetical protein